VASTLRLRRDRVWLEEMVTPGLAIDGMFGPKTEGSVKKFQGISNLKADGIVGPKTWSSLEVSCDLLVAVGNNLCHRKWKY
jgi:peptidoglycan hydrolase-like protein with peptidoglycan-binding domain